MTRMFHMSRSSMKVFQINNFYNAYRLRRTNQVFNVFNAKCMCSTSKDGNTNKDKTIHGIKKKKKSFDEKMAEGLKDMKHVEENKVHYRKEHGPEGLKRAASVFSADIRTTYLDAKDNANKLYEYIAEKTKMIRPSSQKDKLAPKNKTKSDKEIPLNKQQLWTSECDVVIIGGGAVGSSIAYHLKATVNEGLSVMVLDKDYTVSSFVRLQIVDFR